MTKINWPAPFVVWIKFWGASGPVRVGTRNVYEIKTMQYTIFNPLTGKPEQLPVMMCRV